MNQAPGHIQHAEETATAGQTGEDVETATSRRAGGAARAD